MFKPDAIVNLVDDLDEIRKKLEPHLQWKGQLTPADILDWRNDEAVVSRMLTTYSNTRFYVLSPKESPDVLLHLITEPDRPKAYLSFSITNAEENDRNQVGAARDPLWKYFTLFDPHAIKENTLTKDDPSLTEEVR